MSASAFSFLCFLKEEFGDFEELGDFEFFRSGDPGDFELFRDSGDFGLSEGLPERAFLLVDVPLLLGDFAPLLLGDLQPLADLHFRLVDWGLLGLAGRLVEGDFQSIDEWLISGLEDGRAVAVPLLGE